ncbi:MAG: hypothetical protein LBM93_06130 [Oscillospiraceae bacterium]|jgi:hypothetical protein|nr:hypothetical protein [Oscillospiraceae bacterium]
MKENPDQKNVLCRLFESRLYTADTETSAIFALVSVRFSGELPNEINMDDALTDDTLSISFIYLKSPVSIQSSTDVETFTERFDLLAQKGRGFFFGDTALYFSAGDVFCTENGTNFQIAETVSLSIKPYIKMTFNKTDLTLTFDNNNQGLDFTNYHYGDNPFSGAVFHLSSGILTFFFYVKDSSYFLKVFKPGFVYGYPADNSGDIEKITRIEFPFCNSFYDNSFNLNVSLSLANPCEIQMLFSNEGIRILTPISTVLGEDVVLTSTAGAGFGVPLKPYGDASYVTVPIGGYKISSAYDTAKSGILCGFYGTEYFICTENASINFTNKETSDVIGCGAFAPKFPAAAPSISDFTDPAGKSPLDDRFSTAYISFPVGTKYYSQPSDNPYYTGNGEILDYAPLCNTLTANSPFFPLVPMNSDEALKKSFETTVISPARAVFVNDSVNLRLFCSDLLAANDTSSATIAAPSGYLLTVTDTNSIKRIALSEEVFFDNPPQTLVSAFNTAGMMLVISDDEVLKNTFKITFSDWKFNFTLGKTVMVVKSLRGKLFDVDNHSHSLIGNISTWTQKDAFTAGQSASIASSLMQTISNLLTQKDQEEIYIKPLYDAVTDENWQGFLFFNTSLEKSVFPDELALLFPSDASAGAVKLNFFGARRIDLCPSENGPMFAGTAEYFGYASYKAQGFSSGAVSPKNSDTSEFRSLELKAAFEKAQMKDFNSTAQLYLSQLFGIKPKTNALGTVMLKGIYTNRGGKRVFTLKTFNNYTAIGNDFVNTDIINVNVATVSEYKTFTIDGKISFAKLDNGDIFSYDELLFSGLQIVQNDTDNSFFHDYSKVSFDTANSICRDNSAIKAFNLIPISLIKSADGFLQTAYSNSGKLSDMTGGIVYNLNLGTTGAASSNSPISIKMLIGFTSEGKPVIGVKLPGVTAIEGVLSLTAEAVKLEYKDNNFALFLPNIALKILGLLKLPTSGSLSAALYSGGGWFAVINNNK